MTLVVVSGKDGAGKSTPLFELMVELGSVIMDTNLGMANLPYAPGPGLCDVLTGWTNLLEIIRSGGSVSILSYGRALAGVWATDTRLLADALCVVRMAYGDVVVDYPVGMRVDAGAPLAVVDACVVIASPKGYALADAIRARELVCELDCGPVIIAINRVTDVVPLDALANVLGVSVTGIPADSWLAEAIERFEPVVVLSPESLPSVRIRELADAVRASDR